MLKKGQPGGDLAVDGPEEDFQHHGWDGFKHKGCQFTVGTVRLRQKSPGWLFALKIYRKGTVIHKKMSDSVLTSMNYAGKAGERYARKWIDVNFGSIGEG